MARMQNEAIFGDGPQDISILQDRIRAICLIENKITKKKGSGFFSKVSVDGTGDIYGIFTCNHVLGSGLEAETAEVVFAYEGNNPGEKVQLKPGVKFLTNPELDYTFIGINKEDIANLKCSVEHQIQPIIIEPTAEANEEDKVIIVQHPRGKNKKWSFGTILRVEKPFVSYKADTEPGSSGSPVFTFYGHKLIAIHKRGKEGDCNSGTLCCEVLEHITSGTYTKPGGTFSSSENPDQQPTEGFSKSNDKPSDKVLNKLAREICAVWEGVGRELEVPQGKIDEILVSNLYPTVQNKAFQMLKAWKNRGKSVTYDELCTALKEHGLNELAESLRKGPGPFSSLMAASLTAHILSDPIVFQDWPHYESTSERKQAAGASSSKSFPDVLHGEGLKRKKVEKGNADVKDEVEPTSKKPKPQGLKRIKAKKSETKGEKGDMTMKDGIPSDDELEGLSKRIEDWKSLGRRLKFHKAELTGVHKDNEEWSEKAYAMLMAWKQREGVAATYQVLHDALCHDLVNRLDLAQQVCCHYQTRGNVFPQDF